MSTIRVTQSLLREQLSYADSQTQDLARLYIASNNYNLQAGTFTHLYQSHIGDVNYDDGEDKKAEKTDNPIMPIVYLKPNLAHSNSIPRACWAYQTMLERIPLELMDGDDTDLNKLPLSYFNDIPIAIGTNYIRYAIPGTDLAEFIVKQKKLLLDEVKDLIIDAILAVYTFHCHGLILRDIKANNFLIRSFKGQYYLRQIDFDGVCICDENGVITDWYDQGMLYTFTSPEVSYHGEHHFQSGLDAKAADLFSLGHMITIEIAKLLSNNYTARNELVSEFRHLTSQDPKTRGTIEDLINHPYLGGKDAFDRRIKAAHTRERAKKIDGLTITPKKIGDLTYLRPEPFRTLVRDATNLADAIETNVQGPSQLNTILTMQAKVATTAQQKIPRDYVSYAKKIDEACEDATVSFVLEQKLNDPSAKKFQLSEAKPLFRVSIGLGLTELAGIALCCAFLTTNMVGWIILCSLALAVLGGVTAKLLKCETKRDQTKKQLAKHPPAIAKLLHEQQEVFTKEKIPENVSLPLTEKGFYLNPTVRKSGSGSYSYEIQKCTFLANPQQQGLYFNKTRRELFIETTDLRRRIYQNTPEFTEKLNTICAPKLA